MGVKLITGATGEHNIQAADDRECLAGITGLDSYVFPTGSQLKATLVDANTVTIGTGAGSLQGSRFRCSTTTTVNIQSGTQGQFRHDIVGLHFSRETSGREGLEFQVLTGEPAASEGAAADPAYTVGDLLKGDAEAFMPLYRVKLSGINAADPEQMFSILTPLATLQDSVSQAQGAFRPANGWSVQAGKVMRSGDCVTMWLDVAAGTGTNKNPGVTFATMPIEFAPRNYDLELPVLGFTTTSYPVSFWIRITTKGEIKIKQYVLPQNTVLGQIKSCCTYLRI